MADNMDDLKREFENLKKEYESLFRGEQVPFKQMANGPTEAARQIKVFKTTIEQARREASGLSGVFDDLNKQLKNNLAEIDKSNSSINMGKKAYREIVDTVRKLADEEAGIDRLSFQQLKKLRSRNESALKEMKIAGARLAQEKQIKSVADIKGKDLDDYEEGLIRAYLTSFAYEKKATRFIGYRLDLERKVLDTVKLTGGALSGVSNLASSLGLQGFAESLEEIKGGLDDDLRKSIRKAAEQRFDTDNAGEYAKAQADIVSATKEIKRS